MKHKTYYLQIYQYIFTNPEVFPEKLPIILVLKSYDYHHICISLRSDVFTKTLWKGIKTNYQKNKKIHKEQMLIWNIACQKISGKENYFFLWKISMFVIPSFLNQQRHIIRLKMMV